MIDGYILHHHESLDSTNSEAIRIAERGGSDGVVILADTQTEGRGRYGKSWVSLPNNLQFSVLSRVVGINNISQLALVAAVAVGDAIDEIALHRFNVRYKWPNDILIDDKKVAGILLESRVNQDWVVVGIGLNVSLSPFGSVSLADYLHITTELKGKLLNLIIEKYDSLKRLWMNSGFRAIRTLWLKRAWRLGEIFSVNMLNSQLIGKFIDLDMHGRAIFLQGAKQVVVDCGEIFSA